MYNSKPHPPLPVCVSQLQILLIQKIHYTGIHNHRGWQIMLMANGDYWGLMGIYFHPINPSWGLLGLIGD